jgi:hypothetical protein
MADIDQNQLKSAFDSLLGYIDKPWKVFAIAFLGLLAFASYFVWENQAIMIGAYSKSKERPVLNSSRFDQAARTVFKGTNADVVVIFSVDSILGKRVVERIYVADGSRYKEFDGYDIGLFNRNVNNNNDIIRLMANEIPCADYLVAQSEIGLWYKSIGINYTCRISVPPDSNQFIGQLTAGWKQKPKDDPESILSISALMLSRK